jgi:hypothetical protein
LSIALHCAAHGERGEQRARTLSSVEATGELAWFRGEIWRSLTQPRSFARDLAREHYGLAGVLVALVAGVCLSVGIDLLVLASKGISPGGFVSRMVIDAMLLGVRLAITCAVVAWVATGAVRLLGRTGGSLDQLFTALTFATAPLVVIPVVGALVAIAPATLTFTLAILVVLAMALRVVVGLALNIRSILPPTIAIVVFLVVIGLGALVLGDQVSRIRFLTYAIAPEKVQVAGLTIQAVPDFTVTPATGQTFEMLGFNLTLPAGWKNATSGVRGEAARFESSTATLVVARAPGAALSTVDSYADAVAAPQKVGWTDQWHERAVTRINGVVMVDDQYGGTYEGRRVVLRQFTAVPGGQGLAIVYRIVEPENQQASLNEAAAIAATWHITSEGR